MKIGEKIKEQRIKKGWTQEQLGSLLNVSRSAISSWEVGRNYPDLETIISISDLFEIPLDNLLREDMEVAQNMSKKIKMNKYYKLSFQILFSILIFFLCFSFYSKISRTHLIKNLESYGWKPVYSDNSNVKQFELIEGHIDYYINMGTSKSKIKVITRKDNLVIETTDENNIELIISKSNDSSVDKEINVKVNKNLELSNKGLDNKQLIESSTNDFVEKYINKNKKEYLEMIDSTLKKIKEINN